MNTAKLKTYAPEARRDFIKAVTERAHYFGIDADNIETATVQGDVAIIAGRPFPVRIMEQRNRLIERVQREGFELTMRKVAYTWFNRFMALRYMELHNYLDHGFRVLSNPSGSQTPEILEQAAHAELVGLDRDKVVELKLDGTKDGELYRMLIIAECNTLHRAMPFLFEAIDGSSQLLLPDNLLHSDSIIRKLVNGIDEEDWQEIEIIGWLYQFYISDKKDEVIGKVVKSEDIPAATQLFTPNWIVKYMVQNSLGAQWLATYPESSIKGQMEYYIEPAEQTNEVNAQLAAITPDTLDPEALTLIDPACGSGHILVEAYDLFKVIYIERGYRQRDIAQLILEKNLFGLDIDERAAQMSGFALMMKGRADDRRLFERGVKLNVMALVDSEEINGEELGVSDKELGAAVEELVALFEHATTFGSLIQVPESLAAQLPHLQELCEQESGDLFVTDALNRLRPLVLQAKLLAAQYDAVVANPPYMGGKGMNMLVTKFAKDEFPDAKNDLFACFIQRGCILAREGGATAMVTMQSWMFLSSFEKMRMQLLRTKTISTMAHLGARAFGSISGEVVQTTAFVLKNRLPLAYKPVFFRLLNGGEKDKRLALVSGEHRFDTAAQGEFERIPGSPVAYWVSEQFRRVFTDGVGLKTYSEVKHGLSTGKNEAVVRSWPEISAIELGLNYGSREDALSSGKKWFPYNKGGAFRKWYGNCEYVLRYDRYGNKLMNSFSGHRHDGRSHYFKEGVTWTFISSASFAARYTPPGFVFDVSGSSLFCRDPKNIVAFLCSGLCYQYLKTLNPTINFQVGNLKSLPIVISALTWNQSRVGQIAECAYLATRCDWDAYERSWDFQSLPVLMASDDSTPTLESSYTAWVTQNRDTIAEMKRLEEENNRLFIDAYGLQDELTPEVPIEQITLTVNPAYRYGKKEEQWSVESGFSEELETRFREDTMKELISYAIGCMMGRYSLDESGLIYAHAGNEDFDLSRYKTYPADDDGIVPITDMDWFDDDATNRVHEFLIAVWGADTIAENMEFLAENLGKKSTETPEDTIRRYLSVNFFKDHLQTYKKRPIHWLFSSGKSKAFECLVYLHRYNESTLSRMRNEYVIPLQGKYAARADYLANEIGQAASASAQKKLQKELDNLKKKQTELTKFDEELRHYADQRIAIDLDDGVKVNYGKFGNLLAEVKKVTGKK